MAQPSVNQPHVRNIIIDDQKRERGSDDKDPEEKEKEEFKNLIDITEESQEELISVSTAFPYNLFPDTITVDRQKITIVRRRFFQTAEITISKLGDIINVEASVGPMYGSVKIYSRYMTDSSYEMHHLARTSAETLQRILQGMLIAHEKGIDSALIPRRELVPMLLELGHPL